jgi:hypothetical protein
VLPVTYILLCKNITRCKLPRWTAEEILDPGWILERDRLSRNIPGEDARSRVNTPAKPFNPHAVASVDGVDVLCPASATARLDMLMKLQPCRRLMRSVNLS